VIGDVENVKISISVGDINVIFVKNIKKKGGDQAHIIGVKDMTKIGEEEKGVEDMMIRLIQLLYLVVNQAHVVEAGIGIENIRGDILDQDLDQTDMLGI
jgi:hypothetical protein